MAAIPAFVDLAPFALRFFTATDFFAVFRDFAAFFIVLAIYSPGADASLRFAAVFARLGALATAVTFFPRRERYSCTLYRSTPLQCVASARRTRPLSRAYSPTSLIASSSQHVGSVRGRRPNAYA